MFRNYLKTAWRNLLRNQSTAIINIGGLSLGMAVALIIGLWIGDELSFDHYHQHYNQVAKVMQSRTNNGVTSTGDMEPLPLANTLRTTYGSNFKYVVLASGTWQHILSIGDKHLTMNGSYMQAEIPDMLTLQMISGTRAALKDPSSVLLTETSAKALFGNVDATGKILRLDNKMTVKVGGVFHDLPSNTTFSNLAFIAAWDLYKIADPNLVKSGGDWGNNSYTLYVQLQDGADMDNVSALIKEAKLRNVDAESAKLKPVIFLHPMSKWHLYAEFKNGLNTGGAITYVWLFGIIGIFVLLLACINFMNLSTARSEKRAREVGVRKAVGSLRGQLILQFYTESVLLALLSFGLSLVLVEFALPHFNHVADKSLIILWQSPVFWLTGCVFSFFTGILAGSYPALYLSGFKPAKVLKGTFRAGKMAAMPRQVLVVVQFCVSIVLIIGTLVIFRQVRYSQEREVGYNRAGLLAMEMYSPAIHSHFAAFRNDMLNSGAVIDVAESGSPTTNIYNTVGGLKWSGKDPNLNDEFAMVGASMQYGKTVGWTLSQGRDFSAAFASDSSAVILNEAAVSYMNLKKPVGQTIDWWGRKYQVVGVVRNLVMQSPYEPVKQSIFFINKDAGNFLNIRLNPKQDLPAALKSVANVWKNHVPEEPFDFKFADQEYQKKFAMEQKIGTLASLFTGLAILISCLGLFGMAVFMAEQRSKEIGVRKVLGASVLNLWLLLCRDFLVLIVIALLIAAPVAAFIMHGWLEHYSYHVGLSVWLFGLTAAGALAITMLTVSYQSIKAALANPVRSLRSE
ncbi:ABC transporter permease [Mucilaginibacter dorajii]|uniref:ABC transporter permease n=1 Tax=Mucilaginibacter dorajii TaxID=692994 RepID=A0ABP7P960_9SPHI|nr:ABC transporter permease [Mucilaginibacter dorajii]MCS3735319.1 ABC-type antimicrobial peptide transport system permease subunit [Mucilaginibacter dorajii]